MTLIEALKSCRKIRRPNQMWLDTEPLSLNARKDIKFNIRDVIADDWEIQPEPVVFETNIFEFYVGRSGGFVTSPKDSICQATNGAIVHEGIKPLIGKRVRCEVTVIE